MTALEYVEVLAVEQAVYDARSRVRACHIGRPSDPDAMDWKRYINALDGELWLRHLNGVR